MNIFHIFNNIIGNKATGCRNNICCMCKTHDYFASKLTNRGLKYQNNNLGIMRQLIHFSRAS